MIEAYKIAANLSITGDAHKKMAELAKNAERLSKHIDSLTKKMPGLARDFQRLETSLSIMNPLMSGISKNFKDLSRTMPSVSDGFSKFNSKISSTEQRLDKLSNKATHTSRRLSVLGQVASGAGIHIGSPATMVGAGAAGAIGASWHYGSEYEKNITQIKAMGYSPAQIQEARAFTGTGKPGISSVTQSEAFKSALMATQDFNMAKRIAPILAQNAIASKMYGGMTQKQIDDAVRAAEYAGGSDPDKVAAYLTTVLQATALSAGTLMPGMQKTFMTQGGFASGRFSAASYLAMEPLMQEYGASKAGTAYYSGYRAFTNPQISNFARYKVDKLKKLGMWDSKSNMMEKGLLNLYETNYPAFVQEWVKRLNKGGYTSDAQVAEMTTSLMPGTTGRMTNLAIKNRDKMMRQQQVISQLPAGKELLGLYQTSQSGAMNRFTESFASFAKSLNDLMSPGTIEGLNMFAHVFEVMAKHIPSPTDIGGFFFRGFHADKQSIVDAATMPVDVTAPSSSNKYNIPPILMVTNEGVLARSVTKALSNKFAGNILAQTSTSSGNPALNVPAIGINNIGNQSQ